MSLLHNDTYTVAAEFILIAVKMIGVPFPFLAFGSVPSDSTEIDLFNSTVFNMYVVQQTD